MFQYTDTVCERHKNGYAKLCEFLMLASVVSLFLVVPG